MQGSYNHNPQARHENPSRSSRKSAMQLSSRDVLARAGDQPKPGDRLMVLAKDMIHFDKPCSTHMHIYYTLARAYVDKEATDINAHVDT